MSSQPAAIPLRSRLREKLPEILIEAGSVVLALLLAFAANAWHEHSQRAEAAARARAAILTELASNREQLAGTVNSITASMSQMQKEIGALDKPGGGMVSIKVPFHPLVPSSAAWHSAQTTGMVRDFDYAWMLKVAQVYDLQALFLQAQQEVMYPPTPVAVPGMEKPHSAARRFYGQMELKRYLLRMQVLASWGNALKRVYATALDN